MHNDSAASAGILAFMGAYFLFVALAVILALVINWKIASKAGYSGALSLLMLIPIANFIILIIFAFSKWPIEERLEAARMGTIANV